MLPNAPTVHQEDIDQQEVLSVLFYDVQYDSEANIRTSEIDMSHLISRCTAIAANDRSTRTIGIAVIVIPNSAEEWLTTRIKSCVGSYFRNGYEKGIKPESPAW